MREPPKPRFSTGTGAISSASVDQSRMLELPTKTTAPGAT